MSSEDHELVAGAVEAAREAIRELDGRIAAISVPHLLGANFSVESLLREERPVNAINPKHYRAHPSGVECIDIVEHHDFCTGNAIKYLWRAGQKGDELEDLEKALWYLERRVDRLRQERGLPPRTAPQS